ncbi:MAG: hydantoinase B/oxoprolinase family protein [Desulfobulbaceae bacterium]|nr:hydantoinase B/oxoprolinase family protein [Desulfobulbaceae bacterium]
MKDSAMDVIEVEVFNKLFASIAEEMGIILTRSSFSSNIKERRDFSCAIFDSRGDLVSQAAHIPVHLGAMPKTLQHVLASHCFAPGDVIIANDPFHGGSHLPDITLVEAVHDKSGKPLFYAVNRAHHADVGGKNPGSMGFVTDIADEGVLIPPTLLACRGQLNNDFLAGFLAGVRNPEERQGDLRAQLAALKRGKTRLLELHDKYGGKHVASIIGQLQDYAERLMRATIAALPDGTYEFCDFLDNDGITRKKLPIRVQLTIDHDEAVVDFSGSADQVGSPLNTVESVVTSATVYVFQCLMGEGFPINQGSYRPIRIITRPGSLLHALPPAPVAAGNVETSQRIVDTLFGALAQASPEKIPAASCGSMNNIAIGGIDHRTGRQYTYYETIGGGMGARPDRPGISAIHTHMTNTMNTPVEALEHSYPLQIEKYAIRYGSGGKGKEQGGDGIIRSYRFLSTGQVSLLTERREISPYGLQGGSSGRKGENLLIRQGKIKKIAGKTNLAVIPGDRLIIKTPGGGGWGRPK